MATHTSPMAVVINPRRYGWEPVDIFFGEVRPRQPKISTTGDDYTMVLKGDGLRHLETGVVGTFIAREGETLIVEELETP